MIESRPAVRSLVGLAAWLVAVLVGLWPGASRAAPASAGLAVAIERAEDPGPLCPGELRRVSLALRNVGTTVWDPARGDRVVYHGLDEAGGVVVRDGERTPLPGPVGPEQGIELAARLRAPDAPGRYRLAWALVRERVRWVESDDAGRPVEVRGEAPALAWSRVSGGRPESVRAGDELELTLRVRNDGCATWSTAQGDRMAYRWYDRDGRLVVAEGQRSLLPELRPGESAELQARVQAPARAGAHALAWQPVREGLGWFPASDALVFVDVVGRSPWAWSLQMIEPLRRMPAGELRSVEVWLSNEGAREWSREEGDALSYRWLDAAGRTVAEGPRTALPSPWLPGDAEVIEAQVVAPTEPGRYRLAWEPVREGVRWYGAAAQPGARLEVEVTPPRLAWALESVEVPGARWARRSGTLRVVLRNTGAEAWSPERGDRLSYRWRDAAGELVLGEGLRTPLPGVVEPGESITLVARVRGPDEPGRFVLELEMVREHVRWFGPPTGGEARLSVRVERLSSYWVVLLGAAGLLALLVLRRAGSPARWRWLLWRVGPALWIGMATAVLVHCFVDLSGAEPWEGAELAVLGPAALLALVLLPLRPRRQGWVGLAALLLLILMALADLAYLHFFGSIVPLTAVLAVHHLVDAEATVGSLLRPSYGWMLTLVPMSAVVLIAWPRGPIAGAPARPRRALAIVAAALALASAPFGVAMQQIYESGVGQRVFSEQDNVGRLGVVGAHLFQLLRELGEWLGPHELTAEQRERLAATLAQRRAARGEARARAPGFGAARGYDVVLVQVEALQGWVLGARVDGQEITPFLNAAQEHALVFDQVFDQTAQGRTSDAEFLVLGAGHPPDRGALAFRFQDDSFYTLAHVLADAGYSTLSSHPYERGFWNRARLHPRYGFADSRFRRELGSGPSIGWGLTDVAFFERIVPVMLEQPRPSFTFLITLSLHHPYEHFPDAYKELELGGLEGRPVGNYLHAMHYADEAIAGLMASLRRAGRADRTLVVAYGDHVTGMGETPEILALAGRSTWDPGAHLALHTVPVIAWVGDESPAELRGRHSTVGGHVDIGPTVLHLLGIEDPRPAAFGRTLLDPEPGFAALSSGGAVDDELAFAASGDGIPRGGICFERAGGRSVPLERCASLAERAAAELEAARWVLEHDLFRAPPGAEPSR
ncbi:MAG: sulfatase-like hydrolase/transferase [Myxococcales bacterium]|nr:sulfatase-like hydrolase/transferase [Myxococcales bacterium]